MSSAAIVIGDLKVKVTGNTFIGSNYHFHFCLHSWGNIAPLGENVFPLYTGRSSSVIYWTSPFVTLGVPGLFCRFYSIFDEKS